MDFTGGTYLFMEAKNQSRSAFFIGNLLSLYTGYVGNLTIRITLITYLKKSEKWAARPVRLFNVCGISLLRSARNFDKCPAYPLYIATMIGRLEDAREH